MLNPGARPSTVCGPGSTGISPPMERGAERDAVERDGGKVGALAALDDDLGDARPERVDTPGTWLATSVALFSCASAWASW